MLNLKNKKALVLGLGVSGYAAARLLLKQGALVKVSDSSDSEKVTERRQILTHCGVQCETGGHTPGFCGDAEVIVASPGVDTAPLYFSGVLRKESELIGELELGFRFSRAPIIAITGTNGKSTVTELIGRILSLSGRHAVVCGNIGTPLSGEYENLTEESVAVVEVSSFQLETIKNFKPHIAVLLNISEDHYQRHVNYSNYKNEKFKIFRNQTASDWAVLHSVFRDDDAIRKINSRTIFFGAGRNGMVIYDNSITFREGDKEEIVIRAGEIPLKGAHNLENAACAALVARIMGISGSDIRRGIMAFKALPHRMEKVGCFNGVEFIDDSKATNIDAVRCALEAVNGKIVLIAGGKDKGGDYLSILPLVREKVKTLVLIGEARAKIKEAFLPVVTVFEAEDMERAVETAFNVSEKGETVMLSPMCSSFDMFSGYKERGEAFQRAIRALEY